VSEREQLERVLRAGRPALRRYALERMTSLGIYPDASLLRELASDTDAEVRNLAQEALRIITKRSVVPGRPEDSVHEAAQEVRPATRTGPTFAVNKLKSAALELLSPCIDILLEIACSEANEELAQQAVATLGKLRAWRTIDPLIALLGQRAVRAEAALALAAIGDLRAVGPICAMVEGHDYESAYALVLALGSFQTRDTMCELIKFLTHPELDVRAQAALSLGQFIGYEEARDALVEVLASGERKLVVSALLALKANEEIEVSESILELFSKTQDSHVRATVMSAFRNAKGDVDFVVDAIDLALVDDDDRVRANAVETLRTLSIDPERKLALLEGLADDKDNRVRGNVAIALGDIDVGRSLGVLETMLASEDKWSRASAVYVGGFVVRPEVERWLVSVLSTEEDEDVLRNTVSSLREHTDGSLTGTLLELLDHVNPVVRAGVVRVLACRSEPRISSELIRRFATEREEDVRADIVSAVGTLGITECTTFLTSVLSDESIRVQANAIESLDRLGRLETMPAIVPFLRSADNRLRANAAVALWHLGLTSVVPGLERMLKHYEGRFRLSAMHALGTIGDGFDTMGLEPRSVHLCSALVSGSDDEESSDLPAPVEESASEAEPELNFDGFGAFEIPSAEDWAPEDLGKIPDPAAPAAAPAAASSLPGTKKDASASQKKDAKASEGADALLVPIPQLTRVGELLDSGDFHAAHDLASSIAQRYSDDPLAYCLLGRAQRKLGEVDASLASWWTGSSFRGHFFPMASDAAEVAQERGDVVAALRCHLQALQAKVEFCSRIIDTMNSVVADDESFVDVSSLVREMMELLPLQPYVFHRLGVALMRHKFYENAWQLLRCANVLERDSLGVQFNLALVSYHTGRWDDCERLSRAVIKRAEPGASERSRAQQLLDFLP